MVGYEGHKIVETKRQIEELMDQVKEDLIHNYVEKAVNSGALSDNTKTPGNYLLAKLIITAYFNVKQPYSPNDKTNKTELKNLEYFI